MQGGNILKAIVCGYERGGTTLVNSLLLSHTELRSGFESGLLLANSPEEYLDKKFADYNGSLIRNGWGITDQDLEYVCSSENWNQAYDRLRERSTVVEDKSAYLFDKTPKYMQFLTDVLYRYQQVPCIVVLRRPEAVIHSWLKRKEGVDLERPNWLLLRRFCRRYNLYAKGYADARSHHPYRVLGINYEDLCKQPQHSLEIILKHIGYEGEIKLREFDPEYGVRGDSVSDEYISEYQRALPVHVIRKIQRLTRRGVRLLEL